MRKGGKDYIREYLGGIVEEAGAGVEVEMEVGRWVVAGREVGR